MVCLFVLPRDEETKTESERERETHTMNDIMDDESFC